MGARRVAALLVAAAALAVPAPASAEHLSQACDSGTTDLVVNADERGLAIITAVIDCAGAEMIRIDALTWTRPDGTAAEGGPRACVRCSTLSSQTVDLLGPEGEYVLSLTYGVRGPRGEIERATTSRAYTWRHRSLAPSERHWTRACTGGAGTVGVDIVPASYGYVRYSGTISCPGAASILIRELSFTPLGGSATRAPAGQSCTAPCSQPLTASGVALPSRDPRVYQVELVFDVHGADFVARPRHRGSWLSPGQGMRMTRTCPTGLERPSCLP